MERVFLLSGGVALRFFLALWLGGLGTQWAHAVGEIPDVKTDTTARPLKPLVPSKAGKPKAKKDTRPAFDAMGQDIQRFGEDVVQRIDRIVKKKTFELGGDPWTMQGIPIVFPSALTGFNVGMRLQFQNIRRQDPHEMEIIAQVQSSDQGLEKHQLQVDFPWAFKDSMRITARLAYDRDVAINYFGIGNRNPYDPVLFDARSPLYQNVRASPTLSLQLFWYLSKHVRGGPLFNFKWTDISYPAGSLLAEQRPLGINGGRTHSAGLALIYDTLDFEPYPSSGWYHELFFNLYHPSVTGSDYTFTRTTYTLRRFIPLHQRLTFAHRTLVEWLGGDVPFFEMSNIAGTQPALAVGGDRFVRGIEGNRIMDKLRVFFGFELRWDPLFLSLFKQDLTIGFVPFFDIGRVWPDLIPIEFDRWNATAGWGVRLIWNSRLVVRFDTAFTTDGLRVAGNIGNSF